MNIPNVIHLIVLKGYHSKNSFKPYLKEKEVNEFEGLLTIITSQNDLNLFSVWRILVSGWQIFASGSELP